MKKTLFLLFSLVFLVSCNENGDKTEERILSDSSGNINQITLIIENELWEGPVGEAIRDNFAAMVEGLPQEEPLFSLSQIPPETFSGFVRKNRSFISVQEGKEAEARIIKDLYARPQTGAIISGESEEELIHIINESSEKMVSAFKETEMKEKQRRMKKSLKKDGKLEEKFGLSLDFPSAYRYALEEEDFVWIRKEIPKGNMEILIYEVPISQIEADTNTIGNIIKMRDSIGKAHIPGPTEGTHMITEEAYAPYLFETEIDGKFAYETRGTWEVKGAFMAGPFLNYAIKDEANNRYLVVEGFVFSPSRGKRDNMFEIDAILQSADIK
ncbi:DUF4837 family protein [Salegentibacter agarivorans]|jgi:hypothetical protein|uniref:DUF4837 domain-containing protein n=1 Tax=Salegentibacter agarivorans TaxID=345907 RepID=A0A1I2MMQ3_9FLAO|nr:DUF4837 family protein [Salegentibacter agarivorans]SFF90411.1 protein of unknown function [Salegentibacter agarivorans]|tara:strand:+ start:676 stop:1656 length:981 start_codon:yes stop_codon:yes gene_type:complete